MLQATLKNMAKPEKIHQSDYSENLEQGLQPKKIYRGICPECVEANLQIDIKPTAQIEPYYTLCRTHHIMQESAQPKEKPIITPKSPKTSSRRSK